MVAFKGGCDKRAHFGKPIAQIDGKICWNRGDRRAAEKKTAEFFGCGLFSIELRGDIGDMGKSVGFRKANGSSCENAPKKDSDPSHMKEGQREKPLIVGSKV